MVNDFDFAYSRVLSWVPSSRISYFPNDSQVRNSRRSNPASNSTSQDKLRSLSTRQAKWDGGKRSARTPSPNQNYEDIWNQYLIFCQNCTLLNSTWSNFFQNWTWHARASFLKFFMGSNQSHGLGSRRFGRWLCPEPSQRHISYLLDKWLNRYGRRENCFCWRSLKRSSCSLRCRWINMLFSLVLGQG
jgi:hypothetical protein